jgi:HEAT repeat protein
LQRSSLLERLYVNRSKERRAGEAAMALICLGPNAAPAFPQLGRLLTEGSLFGAGSSALAILREIGEPAVPTLAAAMTNKTSDMRLIIAMNLGIMGPKAHAAVPALESLLQDPQPGLRNTCIQAIESTTGKPSTNIPPSQVGP